MRITFGLAALLLLFATTPAPATANPKNALDAYVEAPDPAFGWTVDHRFSGPGYHGAVLAMTSQTWLDASKVDKPVWKHWVTVIVPDDLKFSKSFLYITNGDNTDPAPKGPCGALCQDGGRDPFRRGAVGRCSQPAPALCRAA